jgi:hypothetical protein
MHKLELAEALKKEDNSKHDNARISISGIDRSVQIFKES